MGLAVTTVASGGLPVSDVTSGSKTGMAVTEVTQFGMPITKIAGGGGGGMPVVFVTATGGAVAASATWDAATATAVTLSGGNLVATNTGTSSVDQGARGATSAGKTSGKYYFEITSTTYLGGGNNGLGIGTTASTYTGMGNNATTGVNMYISDGSIYANGSSAGVAIGGLSSGTLACIAVDLDNRKIWFRKTISGNWNNSGTANPATNVGGITIPAGTMVPFCTFGGTGGGPNNVLTANFGASAFSGAVPSGFTSGWSA